MEKVLVIAPHADDAELGMGATINKMVNEGVIVDVIILSLPPRVNQKQVWGECTEALKELGVNGDVTFGIDWLEEHGRTFSRFLNPQRFDVHRQDILHLLFQKSKQGYHKVFCPNSKDIHQSHQITFEETRRAFKYTTVWGYELPWNSFGFDNGVYIRVTIDNMAAKHNAIMKYESQMDRGMFSGDLSYELSRVRGQQCHAPYAECFENIRTII